MHIFRGDIAVIRVLVYPIGMIDVHRYGHDSAE